MTMAAAAIPMSVRTRVPDGAAMGSMRVFCHVNAEERTRRRRPDGGVRLAIAARRPRHEAAPGRSCLPAGRPRRPDRSRRRSRGNAGSADIGAGRASTSGSSRDSTQLVADRSNHRFGPGVARRSQHLDGRLRERRSGCGTSRRRARWRCSGGGVAARSCGRDGASIATGAGSADAVASRGRRAGGWRLGSWTGTGTSAAAA